MHIGHYSRIIIESHIEFYNIMFKSHFCHNAIISHFVMFFVMTNCWSYFAIMKPRKYPIYINPLFVPKGSLYNLTVNHINQ